MAAGQNLNAPELVSSQIVVEAPLSFAGSAKRIWKITKGQMAGWQRALMISLALCLILLAWTVVLGWYLIFGLLLVPYRLIRRSQRNRNLHEARHQEMLQVMHSTHMNSPNQQASGYTTQATVAVPAPHAPPPQPAIGQMAQPPAESVAPPHPPSFPGRYEHAFSRGDLTGKSRGSLLRKSWDSYIVGHGEFHRKSGIPPASARRRGADFTRQQVCALSQFV